jgi:HK97 gp10 family phage protein
MPTARVQLNRAALNQVDLAVADGLLEQAQNIVEAANPPDAPPFGKGLVQTGGAAAWAGKKKVGGAKSGGREIKKPRAVRLEAGVTTAVGGFGFPARFQEMGTVHQPARPFLTPVFLAMGKDVAGPIREAVRRHGCSRRP